MTTPTYGLVSSCMIVTPDDPDAWLKPDPAGACARPCVIGIGAGPASYYVECDRCGIAAGHDTALGKGAAWTREEAVRWSREHNKHHHRGERRGGLS